MIRKMIGTILVLVGAFFMIVLLTGGGPVLPHIVGPATVTVLGAILLTFKRKAK
jgi:hypothetical protein